VGAFGLQWIVIGAIYLVTFYDVLRAMFARSAAMPGVSNLELIRAPSRAAACASASAAGHATSCSRRPGREQ